MTGFRLAGLLRVRTLREERARAELALVQARAATASRRAAEHERVVLGASSVASAGTPMFLASVAARSAEVSALTDALVLQSLAQSDVAVARDAWLAARNDSRVVQRLAERHADEQRRARDRSDQHEADERSGSTMARARQPRHQVDPVCGGDQL